MSKNTETPRREDYGKGTMFSRACCGNVGLVERFQVTEGTGHALVKDFGEKMRRLSACVME
jgi:hypothetical protein